MELPHHIYIYKLIKFHYLTDVDGITRNSFNLNPITQKLG